MATDGKNPILLMQPGSFVSNKTPDMFTGQNDAMPTKTPLFEVPACFCREVVSDPQFYNVSISFKCHIHDAVTIDRRPLVTAPPLQLDPNWGSQPKWTPGQISNGQAWGGGFNGQGFNTVGDFAAMENKAIGVLTGKTVTGLEAWTDAAGIPVPAPDKIMQLIQYDPVTGKPGDLIDDLPF